MSAHEPIGSCCSRPRLNGVGGTDDHARARKSSVDRLVNSAHGIDRTAAVAVGAILSALAVVYASALILHSR